MYRLGSCVPLLFCGACLLGCNMPTHKPETCIRYSALFGFKFFDSKDNDISVQELSVDPTTKVGMIKGLTIRNNASDPMTAFIGQQQMYLEGMKQQTEQLNSVINGLQSVVSALMPLASGLPRPVTPVQPPE